MYRDVYKYIQGVHNIHTKQQAAAARPGRPICIKKMRNIVKVSTHRLSEN